MTDTAKIIHALSDALHTLTGKTPMSFASRKQMQEFVESKKLEQQPIQISRERRDLMEQLATNLLNERTGRSYNMYNMDNNQIRALIDNPSNSPKPMINPIHTPNQSSGQTEDELLFKVNQLEKDKRELQQKLELAEKKNAEMLDIANATVGMIGGAAEDCVAGVPPTDNLINATQIAVHNYKELSSTIGSDNSQTDSDVIYNVSEAAVAPLAVALEERKQRIQDLLRGITENTQAMISAGMAKENTGGL
jgi:hypothetical protein